MAKGSDTKLYIALGVLGVLGVGYFLQMEDQKKVEAEHSLEGATSKLPAVSLSEEQTAKITRIELEKPAGDQGNKPAEAQKSVLIKDGDTWKLKEPVEALANQKNVESLLSNLTKLEVKEQVGSGKDSYEKFDVTDDKAVIAAFYEGDKLVRKLWAGKSGGRGQMARVDGTEAVFVLNGYSSFLYGRDTKGWRDMSILELDPEEVKKITIENEHGTYAFDKKDDADDAWDSQFKAPNRGPVAIKEFDPKKVKNLLNAYKKLNATDFGDSETVESAELEPPKAKIVIEMSDGAKKEVLFGGTAEGSSRWAKTADKDQVFAISSWASDWAFAEQEKFQATKKGEDDGDAAPPSMGMPPGMPTMPAGHP